MKEKLTYFIVRLFLMFLTLTTFSAVFSEEKSLEEMGKEKDSSFSIFSYTQENLPLSDSAVSPSFESEIKKQIHFSEKEENLIGLITIPMDRPIDASTAIYVKLALDHYREKGVKCILLELNTPGGEVFSAQRIARLLQDIDVKYGIPVIAFIDSWAISAGAMLAYSSRFIGITNTSIMGAAEPVYVKEGQIESASEKVKSALRSEFSSLATFYNRNPLIAKAMVDFDKSGNLGVMDYQRYMNIKADTRMRNSLGKDEEKKK